MRTVMALTVAAACLFAVPVIVTAQAPDPFRSEVPDRPRPPPPPQVRPAPVASRPIPAPSVASPVPAPSIEVPPQQIDLQGIWTYSAFRFDSSQPFQGTITIPNSTLGQGANGSAEQITQSGERCQMNGILNGPNHEFNVVSVCHNGVWLRVTGVFNGTSINAKVFKPDGQWMGNMTIRR
jgi:hypothetical protein